MLEAAVLKGVRAALAEARPAAAEEDGYLSSSKGRRLRRGSHRHHSRVDKDRQAPRLPRQARAARASQRTASFPRACQRERSSCDRGRRGGYNPRTQALGIGENRMGGIYRRGSKLWLWYFNAAGERIFEATRPDGLAPR
jgi:hypothetical protein